MTKTPDLPFPENLEKFFADVFPKKPKAVTLDRVDELFLSFGGKPERVDNWQAIALTALALYDEHNKKPKIWTPSNDH